MQIEDVPLTAENPLVVLFSPSEITFEQTRFTGPGTNIKFGGKAAVGAGGTPNFSVDGDLNPARAEQPRQNFFLSGTAASASRVGGASSSPRITGTAAVTNASLALLVADERLQATSITGTVRFNGEQASIETLTGRLGGGRFEVTGGTLLAGFRPSQFRLGVRARASASRSLAIVRLPVIDDLRVTADTDIEISGRLESHIVRGTVTVRRAESTREIDLARPHRPPQRNPHHRRRRGRRAGRRDHSRPRHPGPGRSVSCATTWPTPSAR